MSLTNYSLLLIIFPGFIPNLEYISFKSLSILKRSIKIPSWGIFMALVCLWLHQIFMSLESFFCQMQIKPLLGESFASPEFSFLVISDQTSPMTLMTSSSISALERKFQRGERCLLSSPLFKTYLLLLP